MCLFKKKRKKFNNDPNWEGRVSSYELELMQEIDAVIEQEIDFSYQIYVEAKKRAKELNDHYSHEGRQDNFKELKDQGLTGLGENLSPKSLKPKDIVIAWLNSPPHKKIMLKPSNELFAVAVVDRFCCLIVARVPKY